MHTPREPRAIVGPSGETIRPVIKEIRIGNEIRTEAHYTDPKTGQFVTKITVDSRPVNESK